MSEREPAVEWPGPRPDAEEEPSHRAARIADRDHGVEHGDVFDDDQEDDDGGAAA